MLIAGAAFRLPYNSHCTSIVLVFRNLGSRNTLAGCRKIIISGIFDLL